MKLETGDILLKKGNNPLSWVISEVTDSPYTHAGIVYSDPIAVESFMYGVEPVSIQNLKPADVYRLKGSIGTGLIKAQKMEIIDECKKAIERDIGYDYLQLITYAYYAVFGGVNKFNNPRKYICTEFVDRVYKRLNIDLVGDRPLGDITPKDLGESKLLTKFGEIN